MERTILILIQRSSLSKKLRKLAKKVSKRLKRRSGMKMRTL